MSLFGNITKVAKQVTGKVSGFREILNFNPQLTSLVLPPQVQAGIKIFDQASGIAGKFGIKIPTSKDLLGVAQGKLDKFLGGIRNPLLQKFDKVTGQLPGLLEKYQGDAEKVLQSIDWLLIWVLIPTCVTLSLSSFSVQYIA